MKQIRNEMKEIEQLKKQREERWKTLRQENEKAKEKVSEISERKTIRGRTITILPNNGSDDETDNEENNQKDNVEPVPPQSYSCCGEIWCTCDTNELIENENEIEDVDEVAQENEQCYSEKHAEDIISHYSYNPEETTENPNGWGQEYYDMEIYNDPEAYKETLNDHWGTPDLSNEIKRHIDEVWGFWTVAWTYDKNEVTQLLNDVIETRWVTANQPNKGEKWKCTNYCDVENHHVHIWCTICQRRIDHEERLNHNCHFGLGRGQLHPDMDPNHLYNDVFWEESFWAHDNIPTETDEYKRHQEHLQQITNVNKRHISELNGEGTSRTPIIENQEKPQIGKRFKRY